MCEQKALCVATSMYEELAPRYETLKYERDVLLDLIAALHREYAQGVDVIYKYSHQIEAILRGHDLIK